MASLKKKRLQLSEKYKAITEVESGTKPSTLTEEHNYLRNTILTSLLPENKEKIKSASQSGEVTTRMKNVRVGQNENLEKVLFGLI